MAVDYGNYQMGYIEYDNKTSPYPVQQPYPAPYEISYDDQTDTITTNNSTSGTLYLNPDDYFGCPTRPRGRNCELA